MIKEIDTSSKEFQDALNLIQYTHNSVFLTGKAGTGKSTFLKYVCEVTKKKHVVLAPTGIAAINAGGSTLHSFFKLPFYPLVPDDPRYSAKEIRNTLKYSKPLCKIIQEVELIIIDEISMVRADIIDFVDKVLRIYSRNTREPFGGKQMLFIGDVFQLEPVVKADEREILNRFYPNPYFFSARVFQEMELVSIELTKVYRQRDPVFVNVLNHIRTNTAGAADLQLLNTRFGQRVSEEGKDLFVTLATRRDNVDFINSRKLDELPGDTLTFLGEIRGEFPETSLPTPMELCLKPGAQIIFIKNDMARRWVNGTLGIISSIDQDNGDIFVITEVGREFQVERDQWRNTRYTYNEQEKRIEEEELGVYIQYPLRLAWAITIHKSQGLTFRKVVIDFTGGVFAGGQTYVALSRCTSLDGIQLSKPVTRSDIFVRPEIVQFAQEFNSRQSIDKALKQAEADIKYAEALRLFNEGDFTASLDEFFRAIHLRYDIEKPLIKRFISKKLNVINTLKAENTALKKRMRDTQEELDKLAKEYLQMGNECIIQAHDAKAALANFDKALKLNPRFTEAYIRRGVTLLDEGKYRDAEIDFSKALSLSPTSFKAVYNRGKARLEQNEMEGAVADFDKATTLKPEHPKAHELFGDALSRIGKTDEAALQWEIAERLREMKKEK